VWVRRDGSRVDYDELQDEVGPRCWVRAALTTPGCAALGRVGGRRCQPADPLSLQVLGLPRAPSLLPPPTCTRRAPWTGVPRHP
jgi:hypothetical protein